MCRRGPEELSPTSAASTPRGWYPDPWGMVGHRRYWDGRSWTSGIWPAQWDRVPAPTWRGRLITGWVLTIVGLITVTTGIVVRPAPFSVTETTATVRMPLTVKECSAGQTLDINLMWHGQVVSVSDPDPDCRQPYEPGEQLALYVGSDSPSDVGPSAAWILQPDTHDPFDFIGPTQIRSTLIIDGTIFALVPGLACLLSRRRKLRRRLESSQTRVIAEPSADRP
jgi:hypothetical protein